MSTSKFTLSSSSHGKACVRVAKVVRHTDGQQDMLELEVTLQLLGGTDASFLHGDNRQVVSTDTCRNHVYLHAKEADFSTAEDFSLSLSERLLGNYSHITGVLIMISEKPWRRAVVDAIQHRHGFIDASSYGVRSCTLSATRDKAELKSKLGGVSVLKTTQSGWANFVSDMNTTLPPTDERLLATTVSAEWKYSQKTAAQLRNVGFNGVHAKIRDKLLFAFFGPASAGVFSPGVQKSLYEMADAVLRAAPVVEEITISLPNLHFLPCNLPVMQKNGLKFEHDVYIPTSEPYGIITATVSRARRAML